MIKVKVIEKRNPLNLSESKHYGFPINEGIVSLDEIAAELSQRSTVNYSDIDAVLQNFVEFIPFILAMGKSISLGRLGTMRVSFSSQGVDNPKDFNVGLITVKRIIFTPSSQLKNKIRDFKFELARG